MSDIKPNDRQVGGEHYKSALQHWDWVLASGLSYLQGCATKYLVRWRAKNGVEDLKKADHYVEKMIQAHINGQLRPTGPLAVSAAYFCEQNEVDVAETGIIKLIAEWEGPSDLEMARSQISILISAHSGPLTP